MLFVMPACAFRFLHQPSRLKQPFLMSAIGGNVSQNSANERPTSKSGQYQKPKRFRESKLLIRDLIRKLFFAPGAK